MDCAVVTAYEDIRPAMGRRGVREGDAGRSDIPERALWKLWKRRAALQEEFRTGSGRRVRVLYPGRTGTAAGPDFRDALLEVEGVGVVRGDVEIHLRGKDWAAHGHSDDPNYNGVVVHGALRVDEQATRLHSGATVPVIGLDGLLTGKDDDAPTPAFDLWPLLARKGFPRPTSKQEAGELLDRAGDQRFRAKASELGRFTQEQGAEQTLYEALMEGLGYRHNRQPFLKLAQRAPYTTVQRAALRLPPEERAPAILGWLLAISGLGDPAARGRPTGLRRSMAKEERGVASLPCPALQPPGKPHQGRGQAPDPLLGRGAGRGPGSRRRHGPTGPLDQRAGRRGQRRPGLHRGRPGPRTGGQRRAPVPARHRD